MKDVTEAAKEMRQILKKKFPRVRFSVRCDRYSLGESINVSYENGPATVKVDEIAAQFEDIDRDPVSGEILAGGNRYVHVHRKITEDVQSKIENEIWNRFVEGSFRDRTDYNFKVLVARKIQETDIYEIPPEVGHTIYIGG